MFSNLSYQDKQAFFGLLDEYFASRPHLAGAGFGSGSAGPSIPLSSVAPIARMVSNGSAASDAQKAEAGKGLSSLFSSLRGPSTSSASATGTGAPPTPSSPTYPASAPGKNSTSSLPLSSSVADEPPRKLTKEEKAEVAQFKREQMLARGAFGAIKMATGTARTGLGMVARNDKFMESIGPAAGAVRVADNAVGKSLPFQKKKKAPEPPGANGAAAAGPGPQASAPPSRTLAPPQRNVPTTTTAVAVVQQEYEAEGQAQALYDYEGGGDADDLPIQAGQIVNVLAKTSADWWQCEDGNGSRGLVPANYLKEI